MFIITCIAELLQTGYVRMSLLWRSYACLMFHQDGLQENPLVAIVISYSLGIIGLLLVFLLLFKLTGPS